MNRKIIRLIIPFFALAILFPTHGLAQFEGMLSYKRKSKIDTILCNFYVKEPLIKYEEVFTNGSVKRYIIVDLENGKSATVYPTQNRVERNTLPPEASNGRYNIFKKENSKSIEGKSCKQWIVKSDAQQAMMIFYVYKGEFSFFSRMAPYAAHFADIFRFYSSIASSTGYIPLGIKKTGLLWEPYFEYELLSIHPQNIPESNYIIPE